MQDSHSFYIGQPMNSTAVKLLQAAAEFAGGAKQLAVRLDIADRQPLIQLAATRTSGVGGDSNQ
jgi:hypothetical protein